MFFLLACSAVESFPLGSRSSHASTARRFRTLSVDCAGGTAYTSIGDAIDDARSGDLITVAPCVYEGFSFKGTSVRIQSTDGALVTSIVAEPGEPAITAKRGEAAGTAVVGFTITGGGGLEEPAIDVQFSSLTLQDVIVTGNVGTATLASNYGHVLLERAVFESNTASGGAVLHERRGMIVLSDTVVRCGEVPTGYWTEHGAAFADRATFDCAGTVAASVYHSSGHFERSIFSGTLSVENEELEHERTLVEGSVLRDGLVAQTGSVELRNVVSYGPLRATDARLTITDSVVTGSVCGVEAVRSTVEVTSSDFWNNAADACGVDSPVGVNGTFSADPRFVHAETFDVHLLPDSPCVDAGTGDPDPDDTPNDIGAYGGRLSLGGGW